MATTITTPLVDESRSIESIVDVQYVRQNANQALAERVFNGYQTGEDIVLRPPDDGGSGSSSSGGDDTSGNSSGGGSGSSSSEGGLADPQQRTGNDGATYNDPDAGESTPDRDTSGGGQVPGDVDISSIVNEAVSDAVAANQDSTSAAGSSSKSSSVMGVSTPVALGAAAVLAIVVMGEL